MLRLEGVALRRIELDREDVLETRRQHCGVGQEGLEELLRQVVADRVDLLQAGAAVDAEATEMRVPLGDSAALGERPALVELGKG